MAYTLKNSIYDYSKKSTLWDFHEELTDKLYEVFVLLYEEEVLFHSQATDLMVKTVIDLISECELMMNTKKLTRSKFLPVSGLFFGQPNAFERIAILQLQKKDVEADDDFRDGGMPQHFDTPFIGLIADTELWKDRWSKLIEKYIQQSNHLKSQQNLKGKLPESTAQKLRKTISKFYWAMGMLRDIRDYSTGILDESSIGLGNAVIMDGKVRYIPSERAVFIGSKHVATLRKGCMEHMVWQMLYRSTQRPRRVGFSALIKCKKEDGKLIFRENIGTYIDSDIAKWNKKFRKFGVTVLHRKHGGIFLKVKRLKLQ